MLTCMCICSVFTISHDEKTPPTVTTTEVQVNLCDSLPVPSENAQDFCGKDSVSDHMLCANRTSVS